MNPAGNQTFESLSFTDSLCLCLPGSIPSWNWPNLCPAWRHWSWQPKKQWRVTANILPQPSSFFVVCILQIFIIYEIVTLRGGGKGFLWGWEMSAKGKKLSSRRHPESIVATLEIPVWGPEGIEGWITGLCGVFLFWILFPRQPRNTTCCARGFKGC